MQAARIPARKAGRSGIVGTLHGDLAEIARKVHHASSNFDITVWADADAHVFFERADRTPELPAGYVAGTYGVGSIPGDIESDLHVLRTERIPASMQCN